MSKKSIIALGIFTVLVAASYFTLSLNEPDATSSLVSSSPPLVDAQSKDEEEANTGAQIAPQLPYQSKHGSLVSSLEGIYFDRDLAVDEEGNIRISSDLKDIFDFFFSAIEEEELETVIGRIDEYLAHKLQEPALSQARKILSDYVAYKSALYEFEIEQSEQIAHLASPGADAGELFSGEYLSLVEQRQAAVEAMRGQFLGEEVHEAFFASREQYDNYMLSKLQITSDQSLNAQQKQDALATLDSQMPAEFLESRRQANPVDSLRSAVAASGSESSEQVYAARASVVGAEAAERLGSLDRQRAEWDQRYASYRVQRDAILGNSGLSEADQSDEISRLQQSLFSETEQVRVKALDQIR